VTGSEVRSKFRSLYKKSVIFDTCTITDLFELNTIYLPLEIFTEAFVSTDIFVEELDKQKVDNLKKLGYNNLPLKTNRGYSLFVQLNEEYPSLSTADKIVISIAYERGIICCTNDKNVRKACNQKGIEYTGTLGILCCAYEHKILDKNTFAGLLFKYEQKSSAYIKPTLIKSIRKVYGISENII